MWMEFTSSGTQTEVDTAFPGRAQLVPARLGRAAGDKEGLMFVAQRMRSPPVNVFAGLQYPNDVVFVS